ncbi:MAG: TonB-dependent receptor [Cyanobacteria bacterium P01_B01_bin.77]
MKTSLQGWKFLLLLLLAGVWTAITEAALARTQRQEPPLTNAVAQAPSIQVTAVRLEQTETDLQIILETAGGELTTPTTSVSGDALIAEFPNAILTLPTREDFEQFEPAEGIAFVQVTTLSTDQVQVVVTGTDSPPTAAITSTPTSLTLGITPGTAPLAETEDSLRLVVTGEQEEGYSPANATTATRTDTPLRDIPQSIQVIPQQVLEDQQIIRLGDALRNVSGIQDTFTIGGGNDAFQIRGFEEGSFLRDGLQDPVLTIRETANIERIEVLKGPASVLFGAIEPGGVVNLVTKQPLSEPFYQVEFQAGSFGLVRPSIDLSGPLTEDGKLLYRLNGAYERSDGFRDFDTDIERVFLAPVLAWQPNEHTNLNLELEYLYDERPFDRGLVAIGDEVADIPFDRVLGELDDFAETESIRAGYRLEHQFNDALTLRNTFNYFNSETESQHIEQAFRIFDETTGNLGRVWTTGDSESKNYQLQTDLVAEFSTGSVDHQLVFGVDLERSEENGESRFDIRNPVFINIFDPVYGAVPRPNIDRIPAFFENDTTTDRLGIYLQDQIALQDNLKLLIGGRFDLVDQDNRAADDSQQQDEAFSPRIGIVYQPIEPVSLYASYSRSFTPNIGSVQEDGSLLTPERGTQYEVGIRGELLDGRLSANLAAFHIVKSNVATSDPNNFMFSVVTGEQRSRGIELDVLGEIMPGWNIIASYAHTDAEITEDSDDTLVGNRLRGVPRNSASLSTTYQIQQGDLEGLGFGLGLFFVDDRNGDIANSYLLDSYVRTDANIFYERDSWRAALNFNNIFDVDYAKGSTDRFRIAPGEPFSIIGSISWKF